MRTIIQAIVASFVLASTAAHAAPLSAPIELEPIVVTASAPTAEELKAATEEDQAEEAQSQVVEAQVGVDPAHE